MSVSDQHKEEQQLHLLCCCSKSPAQQCYCEPAAAASFTKARVWRTNPLEEQVTVLPWAMPDRIPTICLCHLHGKCCLLQHCHRHFGPVILFLIAINCASLFMPCRQHCNHPQHHNLRSKQPACQCYCTCAAPAKSSQLRRCSSTVQSP